MGVEVAVRELPASTRTAREAAQAIGCEVGQIAKSLVFETEQQGSGCLVIASGTNRVDESKLAELMGNPPHLADAEFVRRTTGYTIGGVPPLRLTSDMPVFIDADLLEFRELWAAAGSPFAVVRLTPHQLLRVSGGQVADVAQLGEGSVDSIFIQEIIVPRLGLGTWNLNGQTCREAVRSALALGYRHFDTAEFYRNETEIGDAIRDSGVPRSGIFVTSKVWSDHLGAEEVVRACEASLQRLGTRYLDLYLVHWPSSAVPIEDTMAGMQQLLDQGKVKKVGVSNFSIDLLEKADAALDDRIFCNQVKYHVRYPQAALAEYCREQEILLAAYTPLAKGSLGDEPVLVDIAAEHGKTPHQVALRWLIQQENVSAIPKAAGKDHQVENLGALEFSLTKVEMLRIASIAA
jgi:diketogulonate reductase-like aldo/keto reductase/prolyl-tRNA editing enzyme YbaK/EbsC (Cys-tRNA(Pro) deacylase)